MRRVLFPFAVALLGAFLAKGAADAERFPVAGARVPHTQMLFEIDPIAGASGYLVQIGDDDLADPFAFPALELRTETLTARADRFRFGRSYRWRYAALDASGRPGPFSDAWRFTVLDAPYVDRERFRFRVRGKETPPGVFLLDHARVAVDGTGRPVWFLPADDELAPEPGLVRDLRISPAGTVTYMTLGDALETGLDGALRWRAPREVAPEEGQRGGFHHDFKRLRNGRYMVLVQEPVQKLFPGDETPRTLRYGSVVEYDADGQETWRWDAPDYVADVDLFSKRFQGIHMNAFDVDPSGRFVLVGFRDLSRIVKVDRKSREVVASWGERYPSGEARSQIDAFRNQHDCLLASDGTIVVFNNNAVRDKEAPSGIVRFAPGSGGEPARVVWRWDVPASEGAARKSIAGGNVALLPDDRFLVHMGSVNHLFLVTPDDRVRWEALVERRTPPGEGAQPAEGEASPRELPYLAGGAWQAGRAGEPTAGEWVPFPQYRVNWTSSLWPIWFTVEERPRSGLLHKRRLRIYNEGTEPDAYVVEGAALRGAKTTEPVRSGSWIELDLGAERGPLRVRSTLDPARVRTVGPLDSVSRDRTAE